MGSLLTVTAQQFFDVNGNINTQPYSFSFRTIASSCGRAEFTGDVSVGMVVNSLTPTTNNEVRVDIFNPDQATQAWVYNLRIRSIELVYRLAGSQQWISALNARSEPVLFFDDVSDIVC